MKHGIAVLAAVVGITGAAGTRPGKGDGNGPKGKDVDVDSLYQTVEPDSGDAID